MSSRRKRQKPGGADGAEQIGAEYGECGSGVKCALQRDSGLREISWLMLRGLFRRAHGVEGHSGYPPRRVRVEDSFGLWSL